MKTWVAVVAVLALAACDVKVEVGDGGSGGGTATGGGSATGGGGGTASGGGGGGGVNIPVTCSTALPCPSGQFCFNGLCALGCTSNANCAADQYCDTEFDHLCHNNTVQTCDQASMTCLSSQVCISGFCSTPPPSTTCDPKQATSGNDGCDRYSVCFDNDASSSTPNPRCYTFPPCAADKTCPVGLQGAVCNDGLIPNKAHICLTSMCKTVANCPANWACVKFTATDVLGVCSNKGTGSPCSTNADCLSNNCVGLAGFGVCL